MQLTIDQMLDDELFCQPNLDELSKRNVRLVPKIPTIGQTSLSFGNSGRSRAQIIHVWPDISQYRDTTVAMRSGLKLWNRHARLQSWKNRRNTVQTHDFSPIDHFPLGNQAGLAVTAGGNLVFGINEYIDFEIFDEETGTVMLFAKYRLLYDIYLQFENCGYAIHEHDEDETPRVTNIPTQHVALNKLDYEDSVVLPDNCGCEKHFIVSGSGTSQHKRKNIRKYNKSEKQMQKANKFRQFKETHRTQHLQRRSDKQDLHFYDSATVRPVGDVVDFSGVEEKDSYYYSNQWDAWSADDMRFMSWDDVIHMY